MPDCGTAPRAPASAPGAPSRAKAPVSNARAAASRRNGAKSRGPKTPEGKARSAQNALRHGMRAQIYLVLPQEDPTEFAAFQRALLAELAPQGLLQLMLAQRVVSAAWRLARVDRMEAEALEFRSYDAANAGLALIRDGHSAHTIETLIRYRNAAMTELVRALRMLQALRAGPVHDQAGGTDRPARSEKPGGCVAKAPEPAPQWPNEPERPSGSNGLDPKGGSIADAALARAPAEPAAAAVAPSLEALIRPALGVLAARLREQPNEPEPGRGRREIGGRKAGSHASAA